MMRCMFLAVISLCLLVASADAGPRPQIRYIGIHPVPTVEGGGICYVEGPHVHLYPVVDKTHYRLQDGYFVFIGDVHVYVEPPKPKPVVVVKPVVRARVHHIPSVVIYEHHHHKHKHKHKRCKHHWHDHDDDDD